MTPRPELIRLPLILRSPTRAGSTREAETDLVAEMPVGGRLSQSRMRCGSAIKDGKYFGDLNSRFDKNDLNEGGGSSLDEASVCFCYSFAGTMTWAVAEPADE